MRLLTFFLALLCATAHAETITGRVNSVSDGDTLTLTDAANRQRQIHLSAIDAPEFNQDFGQNSRTGLSALAFGQLASAECRFGIGRPHEYCFVSIDGKDVGLELVRTGMAWWDRRSSAQQTPQARADYEHAEFLAKTQRLGLWNSKNPIPPWEWRRGKTDE